MRPSPFHRLVRFLPILFLALSQLRLAAQGDGIFADFTTSMGNFTCRLEYTVAPKAVANFIGLASGKRAFVDLKTGAARSNAFFDGLTFHRVIKGFMIQGGSPNGLGTDGPGYVFTDEFSASVRHDAPGVLSMANSGPDSNGAQFFVTVEPTPWLNDLHTIFGHVVSGMEIVTAINQVATDAKDKPLTDVVTQSVTIRRVGAAAEAFDLNAQSLPVVKNPPLTVTRAGTDVILNFANHLNTDNQLYVSTNLTTWTATALGLEVTAPVSNTTVRSVGVENQFYRLAQVQYAGSTLAPKNVLGRTLTLKFSGGAGTVTVAFDGSGGGTYTYPPAAPGTVTKYTWVQEAYVGRLWPIQYSKLVAMTLRLSFDSATAGTFSGTVYTSPSPTSASGTFTLSP